VHFVGEGKRDRLRGKGWNPRSRKVRINEKKFKSNGQLGEQRLGELEASGPLGLGGRVVKNETKTTLLPIPFLPSAFEALLRL